MFYKTAQSTNTGRNVDHVLIRFKIPRLMELYSMFGGIYIWKERNR